MARRKQPKPFTVERATLAPFEKSRSSRLGEVWRKRAQVAPSTPDHETDLRGLFSSIPLPVMAGIADLRSRRTKASVLSALELIPADYHALVLAYALQRPGLFERFHIRALLGAIEHAPVEALIGPNAFAVAKCAYERRRGENDDWQPAVTLAKRAA